LTTSLTVRVFATARREVAAGAWRKGKTALPSVVLGMSSMRAMVPGRRHWISPTSCVPRPFTEAVVQLSVTAFETGSPSTRALETSPVGSSSW
jgi:hypothetical protein